MEGRMTQEQKTTPMMEQWHACKKNAPDAVLFFRMGDFYEAFYDDAKILSRELELTLTSRQGIPMSGIPWHASEGYIDKLLEKGYRVAIAEQTEDPKQAKGLVKREIVRIVTPGTAVNSSLISDKSNNFFVALTQVGSQIGLCCLDLTTGELRTFETDSPTSILNELYRLRPAEILTSSQFSSRQEALLSDLKLSYRFLLTVQENWRFDHQLAYNALVGHFQVHNLDGYGLQGHVASINAIGALLTYIKDTLCHPIEHITEIQTYSDQEYMNLDLMTQRNLELTESLHDTSKKYTLLSLLDETSTPMGGRLLRRWIKQPLISLEKIHGRQNAIQQLLENKKELTRLNELLENVRDIERLITKVSAGYASPKDIVALATSFRPMNELKTLVSKFSAHLLAQIATEVTSLPEMTDVIFSAMTDEPPLRVSDGKVIREGFHQELDELRALSLDGKNWIARYQARLKEELDIKTLKVGYNKMFGYYIEVSRGQADKMPDTFQRRQTLVNGERYLSPELKEYESKILTAEERISSIESELFNQIKAKVAGYSKPVLKIAGNIAVLDCLCSLAKVAANSQYTRPVVDNSYILKIEEGRHPIIEMSNLSERFIPNDTFLDHQDERMYLITGPNMAGKSTYIRQVALIAIMAQIGSFVPAKSAHIGIIDKVFTRIGASDDLSRGQSTFMVEMNETANILNNASDRSLVILDEIGRGTSTYDGISIAWSVAEYLLTTEGKQAKTLFATHYWELTNLEEQIPGAVNYRVAVQELDDHIIFLRKIVKGGTDKSYGIHVARLAGMPDWVVNRSKEILLHLEENANRKSAFKPEKSKKKPVVKNQLSKNQLELQLF